MRTLPLEKKQFSLLWQAYCGTGKQASMQELVIAARIMQKLKELSVEDTRAPAGRSLIEMPEGVPVPTLFLEEDEWMLLRQLYETTPWNTLAAIEVVEFKKVLDSLPEHRHSIAVAN